MAKTPAVLPSRMTTRSDDERNLLATFRWLPEEYRRFVLTFSAWAVSMARVFDRRQLPPGVLVFKGKKGGAR
jgi:hypothetical protein